MGDSFLCRAGATRFSVMVVLIGTFRAGLRGEAERKEGSGATVFAFSLGQVIFTKGNLHASLFCPGFKETALNRLLPPSFLIRFPTLVSLLARRATSATSHDVWASCDLAAIVGIISMSSSHPAPLPFLLLLLFFLVPFPRAGDA